MEASPPSPPPAAPPPAWQLAVHALSLPLWGACNPVALAAAFVLAPHREISTNVMAWSPATFLPVGMATAAAVMLGLSALFRVTNRGKASPARLAWGIHVVQAPFLPLLLLTLMAFDGLEGNIIGFIVVPATALWLLVSVPGAIALFVGWTLWSRRAFQQAQAAAGAPR